MENKNETNKAHCCEINCKKDAEFNVQDYGEAKKYEDYTQCCSEHLAEMIGNEMYLITRLRPIKEYKCSNCGEVNNLTDNGEITVGFCKKCKHPLWN